MRKPTTNPDHVEMSDVLCDFCGREWTETLPVVEGHQGSCICGDCLAAAYSALALRNEDLATPGYKCVMCLESRPDPAWRHDARPEAFVCKRCVKQSAAILAKEKDLGWTKPT